MESAGRVSVLKGDLDSRYYDSVSEFAQTVNCKLWSVLSQSWTWIGFIHGLDWVGLDWIGLGLKSYVSKFLQPFLFAQSFTGRAGIVDN